MPSIAFTVSLAILWCPLRLLSAYSANLYPPGGSRLGDASLQLALSTSSVQEIHAPSAGLHSMARGGVCVETPHAFKQRDVRPPAYCLRSP
jgi:hypothetical protein